MEINKNNETKKSPIGAWIFFIASLVYTVIPIDIIPDIIPIAGYVEDGTLLLASGLNLVEQYTDKNNSTLLSILKKLKWALIILGIVAVLLITFLGLLVCA